jgi:2-succinyl-5-enolpyruvyl-6-hydroxy-3-cyclohexene-1-carboxylate synthase
LILAGLFNSGTAQSQAQAIAALSQRLHCPVLADGLSPLRNFYTGDYPLITGYDFILRSQSWGAQLRPAIVIQVGELPTSKTLRAWLTAGDVPVYVLDPSGDNLDARQGRSQFLRLSPLELLRVLPPQSLTEEQKNYNELWLNGELMVQTQLRQALTAIPPLQVSHLFAQLPALLPAHSLIMVANSMPVRHMEYFWPTNQKEFIPYVNRGVNGIDGTLSTALGLAHRDRPTFLLTGDLSFLHDSNGLLIAPFFQGNLTIVLLNNQGGGIFELLPVVESTEPEIFELYFATPQQVDFALLCRSYGVHYEKITALAHLSSLLAARPAVGVQVWEVPGDRRLEAQWLQDLYRQFAAL